MKMDMKSNLTIIFFLIIISASCNREIDECICSSYTEFTFGHFYGECAGEGCIEIFRVDLDQQKLFEDVNDFYPRIDTLYDGSLWVELPDEKFQQVKNLLTFMPAGLLAENETVLGQPDGGDWGGIYFELQTDSGRKFWLLDQMDNNMPREYNDFVDRINEKIVIINE